MKIYFQSAFNNQDVANALETTQDKIYDFTPVVFKFWM